jgi:Cys-tRNA(Pro)/Cys-tRNA(Cys) deacylase
VGETVKTPKTNVIRLLEAEGIAHRVHSYQAGEAVDAVSAAQKVGVEPERVFKTLVASGGGTIHLVFCLPAVLELNLRRAALVSGCRQVELIRPDDLLGLTGYLRGGCSPLAMKKAFPTFLEETAQLFETILISGGLRGLQVELAPDDLLRLGSRLLPRMELASLA